MERQPPPRRATPPFRPKTRGAIRSCARSRGTTRSRTRWTAWTRRVHVYTGSRTTAFGAVHADPQGLHSPGGRLSPPTTPVAALDPDTPTRRLSTPPTDAFQLRPDVRRFAWTLDPQNLERQKIDLDDYLRLTRTLAKEQFFRARGGDGRAEEAGGAGGHVGGEVRLTSRRRRARRNAAAGR